MFLFILKKYNYNVVESKNVQMISSVFVFVDKYFWDLSEKWKVNINLTHVSE